MNNLRFARWRLSLEIAAWRHGLLWPSTLACMGLAAALWAWAVLPQRQRVGELTERLKTPTPAAHHDAPRAPGADPQAQAWRDIRRTWPDATEVDAQIANVLQLAQKQGVAIEQADYQYRLEPGLDALKVTMTMPIRGAYPAVRRLVNAVLLAHPNLALEELAIKRDNVASPDAEVKARWAAWYPVDASKAKAALAASAAQAGPMAESGVAR